MRQTEKEETKKLEQTFKVPVLTTVFSKSYESYPELSNSRENKKKKAVFHQSTIAVKYSTK